MKASRSNYVKLGNLRVAKATELSHSYILIPWHPLKNPTQNNSEVHSQLIKIKY